MEIRTTPYPLLPPVTQTPSGPATPAPVQPGDATTHSATATSGLTEYVSQGELLNGGGDYRTLLRAARQQQAQPSTPHDRPVGSRTLYASRALSAYQANSTGAGTAARAHIDETA